MILETECLLCRGQAVVLENTAGKIYYSCCQCGSVFLDPRFCLSQDQEKERYEQHNNDVDDPRYQQFVRPIIDAVEKKFSIDRSGLDFGAGTGPVVTKLLRDKGYSVEIYDPFFANNTKVFEKKYDFIVCCEVIEHFRDPSKEFHLLRSLLNSQGVLFCMTEIYSPEIDFRSWYYKKDPTHVFFYHRDALEWICRQYGFSSLSIQGRLVQFFI